MTVLSDMTTLPCHSLDMAMTFDSKEEAEAKKEELQKEWTGSELRVCEAPFDDE